MPLLADASHPYPATKLAFQPSTLSSAPTFPGAGGARAGTDASAAAAAAVAAANNYSPSTKESSAQAAASVGLPDFYPDRELLASSADSLRIWEISRNENWAGTVAEAEEESRRVSSHINQSSRRRPGGEVATNLRFELAEKSVLAHSKSANSPPAPMTSFSWNVPSPSLIVTSSIDTTCTIWDLPTRTALTQLIAHDREVYDVDWCPGSSDVFATVGADGSVRIFDQQNLENSTIIYETSSSDSMLSRPPTRNGSASAASVRAPPLLRIAFNPWDANYLATFNLESDTVQVLDVRAPGSPILELRGHTAGINAVAWGPQGGWAGLGPSKGMVCTGADDCQCLVYDLASATLRTASQQGRRSRNSNSMTPGHSHSSMSMHGAPSPAPTSMSTYSASSYSSRVPVEQPVLAYTSHEMVNNVAWLRAPFVKPEPPGPPANPTQPRSDTVVQEWDEYTKGVLPPGQSPAPGSQTAKWKEPDWLALVSGNSVRALRV